MGTPCGAVNTSAVQEMGGRTWGKGQGRLSCRISAFIVFYSSTSMPDVYSADHARVYQILLNQL